MAAKKPAMSKIEDIFELIEMIFGGGLVFVKKKKKLHLVQQSCVWNQESKLIRLPVGNQHVILIYSVLRISLNNLLIPISSKLHFQNLFQIQDTIYIDSQQLASQLQIFKKISLRLCPAYKPECQIVFGHQRSQGLFS